MVRLINIIFFDLMNFGRRVLALALCLSSSLVAKQEKKYLVGGIKGADYVGGDCFLSFGYYSQDFGIDFGVNGKMQSQAKRQTEAKGVVHVFSRYKLDPKVNVYFDYGAVLAKSYEKDTRSNVIERAHDYGTFIGLSHRLNDNFAVSARISPYYLEIEADKDRKHKYFQVGAISVGYFFT